MCSASDKLTQGKVASGAFNFIVWRRKQQALVWGQLLAEMEAEARALEAEGKPGMSAAQLTAFTAEVRAFGF